MDKFEIQCVVYDVRGTSLWTQSFIEIPRKGDVVHNTRHGHRVVQTIIHDESDELTVILGAKIALEDHYGD